MNDKEKTSLGKFISKILRHHPEIIGGAPYGVRWEDVGIDSELPFEEKVRLYMDQMKDRADTLPVDDLEELPFD